MPVSSETWTIYRRHIHSLDKFHLRCLRQIAGIKWQDKIPDTEVLEHCKMTAGIEAFLRQAQLRWSGHLVHMPDTRLPKAIFYSQLSSGSRVCGRPVKRYKDSLKKRLQLCNCHVCLCVIRRQSIPCCSDEKRKKTIQRNERTVYYLKTVRQQKNKFMQ